jgi:hypothetical protein
MEVAGYKTSINGLGSGGLVIVITVMAWCPGIVGSTTYDYISQSEG